MKNLGKALAMLIVFVMVVSTVSFASFTDVSETSSFATAINVGVDLGLFKGYEDGTFQPEGEITRAEFAAIVVRMKGQESQATGAAAATQFNDVPADHWAAGYVNIATQAGIINGYGDGNFGPDDLVAYQDAITMVVRALGYEPAIGSAGYPTGYLTKAGELGLTSGVSGTNGVAANRGTVAQIVFNALDVPIMTQSGYGTFTTYVVNDGYSSTQGTTNVKKTLLSENHNIVRVQGTIDSSTNTTTTSTTAADKVNVTITNQLYNKFGIGDNNGKETVLVGDSNAVDYVGKKVMMFIYYNEFEDECTMVSLYEVNVDSFTVDSEDINDVAANDSRYDLKYYATASSNNTTTVTFVPTNVYYNGVAQANLDATLDEAALISLLNDNLDGTVEFANLGGTTAADYDTLYITDYTTFVVDSVKASTSRVSSKNVPSNGLFGKIRNIDFDASSGDVTATLYDVNGNEMNFTDLEEYDVLSVQYVKTAAKEIVKATVIENTVEGVVRGLSGSVADGDLEVTIGTTTYEVNSKMEDADSIKLGDEGTYYLDARNKVVYFDTRSTSSDNYAYVVAVGEYDDTALVSNAQLKLVTKDGALVIYNVASKIRTVVQDVNDVDKDKDTTETISTSNVDSKDFVTSDLEDTVITFKLNSAGEINTIETAVKVSGATSNEDVFTEHYNGAEQEMSAYDEELMSFLVNGRRLYISENTTIFQKDLDDAEDTELVAIANLREDQILEGAVIYNIDDDDVIGCILLKADNPLNAGNDYGAFVTKISSQQNDEGEDILVFTAYVNAEEVTYTAVESDLDEVPAVGDLIFPSYKANGDVKAFIINDDPDGDRTDHSFISGRLEDVTGNRNLIKVGSVEYKVPASANVYVYDKRLNRNNTIIDAYVDYVEVLDPEEDDRLYDEYGKYYVDNSGTISNVKVYVHEYDGTVVDVVYIIEAGDPYKPSTSTGTETEVTE